MTPLCRHSAQAALAAVLLCGSLVWAQGEGGGVWVAQAQVKPLWSNPNLQGQGRLRVWGFHVYDARLWVPPGFDPAQWQKFPHALELDYARAFKGADIAQRSLQEIQRQGDIPADLAASWLGLMTALFPDVASGDEITGFYQPGQGVRFFWNGRPIGALTDSLLAERFMGIWLSTFTSEPAMRLSLLGLSSPEGRR